MTPFRILAWLKDKSIRRYITINNWLCSRRATRTHTASDLAALDEIKQRAMRPSDISDHLVSLFVETINMNPRLIVELGVRGGESTFVFQRAARLCGAALVSVDIDDCSDVVAADVGQFVRSDDVEFAGSFAQWCSERGIQPAIDVLFIDTSHLYEHTLEELRQWFPHLSPHAKVLLHDTNLKRYYRRRDGTMGRAWNNERGVIRALETYLGRTFDESADFVDFKDGWMIRHYATCNGLTILERPALGKGAGSARAASS